MRSLPTTMTGVGLAAALALWAWLPRDGEMADVPSGQANATRDGASGRSLAAVDRGMPATLAPPIALSLARPSAMAVAAVPITVEAPKTLLVGEMSDLLVGLDVNAGVDEISFTVQFDGNVLQVRAGTDGSWAEGAGPDARFSADISDAEDRVRIRSTVSGHPVGTAGGGVAIVRFQAIAPGTTSALLTDVVVKDFAGRSMAFAVSAPDLQITVDSIPAAQPDAWDQRRAVAVEAASETTEDGD